MLRGRRVDGASAGLDKTYERILPIEPHADPTDIIGFFMEELGFQFGPVTDATICGNDLTKRRYEYVLRNLGLALDDPPKP